MGYHSCTMVSQGHFWSGRNFILVLELWCGGEMVGRHQPYLNYYSRCQY